MGTDRVTNGLDDRCTNSILVLDTRSASSEENDILRRKRSISLDSVAIDGEFIGSECPGFVRA